MKMMKNLILLILFLSILPLLAQNTDNEQRLNELPALIEEAATNENYVLASKLQYELEYRENFKKAIEEKDYTGAAHWQNELDLLLGIKREIPGKRPRYKERYATNKFFMNIDISALGYSHFNYLATNYSTYPPIEESISKFGATVNLKFGFKYFFNNVKKSRIGLDLSVISIQRAGIGKNNLMSGAVVSIFRPGLIYTYFLKPTSGFDLQLNAGAAVFQTYSNYENKDSAGLMISPHIRYWIGHISVGVEYNYGNLFKGRGDYNNLAFTFGFRL